MNKPKAQGWRQEILDKKGEAFSVSELPYHIKLDQNESVLELDSNIKDELLTRFKELDWRLYPQKNLYHEAKAELGNYLGIDPAKIMLTSGGDQVIQALFIISGPRTLIFEPTYPMYRLFALHNNKDARIEVLGPEFRIEPGIFEETFDLVNIVSPNNPTGNLQSKELIEEIAENQGLILVDEAYFEFSGWTVADLTDKYDNLFIARTFSKALSMAGLRMGYCISNADNIKLLENIMFSPYNVNVFTLNVIRNISKLKSHISRVRKTVEQGRAILEKGFSDLGIEYIFSSTNFISFKGTLEMYNYLAEHGIRIRDISGIPGMNGYLRITVGTGKDNLEFLDVINQFKKQ